MKNKLVEEKKKFVFLARENIDIQCVLFKSLLVWLLGEQFQDCGVAPLDVLGLPVLFTQ
jgi:hypothetical protein